MNTLFRKCFAEFFGTMVLVFCALGVAAATSGSLVATSLTFGFSLTAMAYSIGRISGCHINPAVSLGCLLSKRMSVSEFIGYVISQLLGALVGALVVFGLFKMSNVTLAGDACNYFVGYDAKDNPNLMAGGVWAALIAEMILTCIFVYTVLNVTARESRMHKVAGIVVGFTLALVHLIGINLTGTSVNPARSFAAAVASAVYNHSLVALSQVWIFLLAPLVGGALAALMYRMLHQENELSFEED